MNLNETNTDPQALALAALGWVLADDTRAERLLALTGLTPADLRSRLGDPSLLAAILRFLEAYEPDLVACAEALGVAAAALVEARRALEQ
jgi:adenine/guanine phosphoribosyltransferase-like PRPP-binding protein